MSTHPLLVSPDALMDRLFKFSEARRADAHQKFLANMVIGILGSKSTLVANVARFLNETVGLKHTEKRLCRLLNSSKIDWDNLRLRTLELNARLVSDDDVIAFDPGDLSKKYAKKMENLYRVHDGSAGECSNGFEDFSAEAIQWRDGKKFHVPLYQKLISASCEDYISQNRQIIDAIRTIYDNIGSKGIWTFDRGHDRSRIFEKALLQLPIRWVLRAKENRRIIGLEDDVSSEQQTDGLMDLALSMPLSEAPSRLEFPKKTGQLFIGWQKIKLIINDKPTTPLNLVVIHDRRNIKPVVLLTNLDVTSNEQAVVAFGYYLERWGKEEGYRFTKSFLNSENIRTGNWLSTQNLAFLAFLVYVFVALFHRSAPEHIEQLANEKLRHFRHIDSVRFKYYRVGQLMRLMLCEQLGRSAVLPLMTEVG